MVVSIPVLASSPRSADVLVLLLGALMPLAFAPTQWYPLAILLPAVLFLLLEHQSNKRIFWRGWLFGIGMFGVGVSWVFISVHTYGKAAVPVAVLAAAALGAVLATFPAIAGVLGARVRHRGLRLGVALPAAWIGMEWVRSWFLTGFPWLEIGYSQVDSPVGELAPFAGVYGVGLVTMVCAGLLALLLVSAVRARIFCIGMLAALWLGCASLGSVSWTMPRGDTLRVSIVQGNIPQAQKWLPSEQINTVTRYLDLSSEVWEGDVVVWPETAIPMFYHEVEQVLIPHLTEVLQQHDTTLITGIPVLDRDRWQVFNAVMALGASQEFYYKRHLVPFGEYIPLRKWLGGLLEFFTIPLGDFTQGSKDQELLQAAGYPVGASVCYEVAFGREINLALPEAAWLVNVSNDGWFGDSLAPHQHLQMARMRARETERYLLRATNTGISALIGPDGDLIETAPQFEPLVIKGVIEPLSGATPYVRWGNTPVVVLVFMIFIAALLRSPRRS